MNRGVLFSILRIDSRCSSGVALNASRVGLYGPRNDDSNKDECIYLYGIIEQMRGLKAQGLKEIAAALSAQESKQNSPTSP